MLKSLLIATTLFSGVLSPFNSLETNTNIFNEDIVRFVSDYQHQMPELDSNFEYNESQYILIDDVYIYNDVFNNAYSFNFYTMSEDYYFLVYFKNYDVRLQLNFSNDALTSDFYTLDLEHYYYDFEMSLDRTEEGYSYNLIFYETNRKNGNINYLWEEEYSVSGYQLETGYMNLSEFFTEYYNFITEVLTEYNKPTNSLFYTIYKGVSNYIDVLKTTFTDMSNIFYVNGSLTPISWLLLIGISIGITKFGLTYLKNQVRK